jgi:dihydrofolate reductase
MRKLVLFMHTSLDGYVARPMGEMDWIHVNDEMFDFADRQTQDADLAIYGRRTFNMMESYWPTAAENPRATKHDIVHSAWYRSVGKIVFSTTLEHSNSPLTQIRSEFNHQEIQDLKTQNGNNILMFGSPSIAHLLMQHHLIDDYWLFVNPILLGKGLPLFTTTKQITRLRLEECTTFSSGVIGMHYVKR